MIVLRDVAKALSRGVLVRRRLPAQFGGAHILLSPESQLKYLLPSLGGFDRNLLAIALETIQHDSVVWDVGANVGVFTFASAGLARDGRVVAFEPDPFLLHALMRSRSLRQNRHLHVDIVSGALFDRTGIATLQIQSAGRASNTLAESGGDRPPSGRVLSELFVPTATLDSMLDHVPAPTVLKIDVEGAEHAVLRGAKRILSAVRPVLIIEVGQSSAAAVSELLRQENYALFDARLPPSQRTPMQVCSFDTLALPR